jgi:8-oxo-dGTP pyrophosphatase MutT (NUDIX family)
MDTYSSFGIVWREREVRDPEFLIIPVKYFDSRFAHQSVQVKFMGGSREEMDCDPVMTLRRECREESHLYIRTVEPHLVHVGWNQQSQHFFLFHESETGGALRALRHRDRKSVLGRPRWVPYSRLIRTNSNERHYRQAIFWSHREALICAYREIMINLRCPSTT